MSGWNRPRVFTSWSFTRWSDWDECPARAAWGHLDKLDKDLPKGPALTRGGFLDGETEKFLRGKVRTMHPELKPAAEELKWMRAEKHKIIQEGWAFDVRWNPCSPTDWDRCKLRVKIDFGALHGTHLSITDTKTGQFKEHMNDMYELQLNLYVASSFAQLPTLKTADARLLYTDTNIVYPDPDEMETYTRKEGEQMQKDWDKRVKPMLADRTFRPRPGHYCRWCPFRKNGPLNGPCKY